MNGTTYSSVWIKFQLTFTTQPMAIPSAPEGTLMTFSTPFTATGQFTGYSDSGFTQQVFSVPVQGSGVASSLTMRMMSGSWVAVHGGAQGYGFTGPLPSPWTSTDVGAVGTAGISSFGQGGVFEVAGAGADIWGTADAFQFVSQPLSGDGTVIAHVTGEQTTSSYAKAGVMIRQNTSASAASVILDIRPGGGIEFMTRSAGGGSTTFLAGTTVTSPPWLMLSRTGSTVTARISNDGGTWTTIGTTTLGGSALAGLAVTSHDSTVLNQASFDNVSVTAASSGGGPLPIGWSHGDVGAVGLGGNATYSGGTFAVSGAGSDIWGTADAFHYAYTPMNSDGFIEARVTDERNTNAFAKAGIMFRDSLDPGSTQAILDVKPDGFVEFMTRSSAGGSTTYVTGMQASFPVSLKLRRGYATAVSIITAFVLDSGGTWQQLGYVYLPLGPGATAGLAVTSHDTNLFNTGTFDTVEVEKNLLVEGNFEGYTPPALGPPGWISDQPLRAVKAITNTDRPYDGYQDGACVQTTFEDCGMYQEVTAPATAAYTLTLYATADRSGGLVGADVNGQLGQSASVPVNGPGNFRQVTLHFNASEGATIRVWMYSPASPGMVTIDLVSLTQDFAAP